jgi:hypothetical protein
MDSPFGVNSVHLITAGFNNIREGKKTTNDGKRKWMRRGK